MTISCLWATGFSFVNVWSHLLPFSAPFKDRAYCERIQNDLTTLLGPFAKRVIDEARECSSSLCHGHGRCALTDARAYMAPEVVPSEIKREEKDFRCRCFNGWKGDTCQDKA